MGYTTDFIGGFKLNKQLTLEDKNFLTKFAQSRRMARDIEGYGVEGEFYVDGGYDGFTSEGGVIDHNRPPKTQPGLWCQWTPTEDGWGIEWDGGEKFYNYVEWLEYIIKNFLEPKGYVLNGTSKWQGEDSDDVGKIVVKDNVISLYEGYIAYKDDEDGDNQQVWTAINQALTNAGFKHLGGGDGSFGFEDTYQKGKYKVTVGIKADN